MVAFYHMVNGGFSVQFPFVYTSAMHFFLILVAWKNQNLDENVLLTSNGSQ